MSVIILLLFLSPFSLVMRGEMWHHVWNIGSGEGPRRPSRPNSFSINASTCPGNSEALGWLGMNPVSDTGPK